jgi:hypothetical protein
VSCQEGWDDGSEHNYPTGWPYAHWYVCHGLRRYGFDEEATRIAIKYLRLLAREWVESGVLRERHNVVQPAEPLPGRYPPQRGFGWTNGVFAALLVRVILGVEPDLATGDLSWSSSLPAEWRGQQVRVDLPDFPWPAGSSVEISE